MNERIKELMEQAMELVDPYALEGEFGPKRLNAEKFAELIVRECIGVIGEENYTMLTGKAYCTELKRHFGVSE